MQAVKLARQLGQHTSSSHTEALCHQQQHQQQQQQHDVKGSTGAGLLVPIFVVSSVTGLGLPVLHAFLNALPALPHAAAPLLEPTPQGSGTTAQHAASSVVVTSGQQQPVERGLANGHHRADAGTTAISGQQPPDDRGTANGHQRADAGSMQHSWQQAAATHFQVDHTFEVKGVGCVVSGTVVSGEVAVHQTLNLGPMGEGGFRQVQVTCIHRSQVKLFCLPYPLAMWSVHCCLQGIHFML